MSSAPVVFKLADGTMLTVKAADLQGLYETLWLLADRRGAVSAAGIVLGETRHEVSARAPIDLSVDQSAAVREALTRLGGVRGEQE